MDVRMPDGTVITNVPDNITQTELLRRYNMSKGEAPPPVDAGFSLADTATALKQGVVGSVKALTDVFGAENIASAKLGAIQKELGEEYTPARKAEMARREVLQQQAAKTGTVGDEISTFLAGVAEAPVQSLAQGLGSIVPYIGTGILGAFAKLAAPTVRAVNTAVGAAQGAGSVKGSLYDNVKNELVKSGYSEEQADKEAKQAQEYLGDNFLDILGGTALGGVAARFGVENLLTPGASQKLSANLVGRMAKAAAAEAPLEGAQAGQEQLAINRALQKEGFSVGTFEGVLGSAARDAAVGAMVGSAVGIRGPSAPMAKPETEKTISDETKTKEVKDQEAVLQGQPPPPPTMTDAELDALMQPVIDEKGDLLQKGGVDVTQQTDVTASGAGTEVLGGPEATTTAEGAPGAGRPGMVSAESAGVATEGGEGVQQPTLDQTQQPKLDFATWAQQKGISLTDPNQNWAALEAQYNAEIGAAPTIEAAPAVTSTTTTTVKPAKKAAPQVVEGYLNKPSYYSAEKPKNVDEALNYAGHEQAFDLFDTVDIKDGVNPELQRLADERNKEQEAKRQQMRQELTGKIDSETGKKYTPKRITSLVSNIPLYKAGAPLEFLSEEELVNLYRQYAGKRAFLKEEATSRENNKVTREEFVNALDPLQKAKIGFVADRSFADEVIATARRKAQTTEADKRKSREKKQKEKLFFDVQQQVAEAKEDVAQREKAAQTAAEQEALEEDALRATAQEISTAADKVLPKRTKTETVEPVKSKLDVALNKAINEGTVDGVLEVAGDRKLNDRMTGVIAQQFMKILKNFSIDATIDFGRLKAGEDGKFDPKTNKITIRGNAKDGYTGTRPLAETVMHEVSHATLDHVFDNEAEFIKSLPPERRKDVQAALNRLKQNHRVIKDRFGKKYNIDSIKEFAAEYWSNPQLQEDLALMPSPTPYTPKENFFVTVAKNIARALGIGDPREGTAFKEIAEDLAQLISLPTADMRGKEVSYLKKAEPLRADEEIFPEKYEGSAYGLGADYQPKDLKYVKKLFFTKEGWRRIATALQNERYAIKYWEDQNDLAGKIKYEGKDEINNIYGQLTLSVSRAKNLFHEFVQETYDGLNKSVYELSKALNLDMKNTLDSLHRIMEALHDPERRLAKYVMTVPLSVDKNIPQGNTMISAADRREQIMRILNTRTITDAQARQLRSELNTLIFTKDANGRQVPNTKYVDPNGSSPRKGKSAMAIELDNEIYNATGLSPAAAAARLDKYNNLDPKVKSLIDDVLAQTKELHRVTTDLNRSANYWSQPVSNRVAFYGFENYVPLKGIDKHSEADELLDFDSAKLGKELQETTYSFDGRMSVSDNPVLQSMSDAVRAAMRAGRVDLTQSIKNAVKPNKLNPKGQGLLEGEVIKTLSFQDRQDENILKALPRENTIFHYNPDGSIDVIAIRDRAQREAIRRTYRDTNSLVNFANNITSALGMMHTRYNYNFAPLNFVRDALTNAWALGAEMGPAEAARFIAQISNKVVVGNSLRKGMKVATLYETKDYAKIRELAKKDPIYKEMVEFIEEGGMVEYLQGISLKSNAQQLYKEVGRSGIMTKWDQFNRLLDIWTDMFELSSRSAAYGIAKRNFMDKGLNEAQAKTKAAAYAKNLANFEQVGKYGREMGAAFMFFRPSATGAVRAIEAVAPAFQKLDKVVAALPDNIKSDPKALAEFKANYAFRQKSARYMVTALMGAGAFAYMMALMMADEDDLGRNKVMNDDMNQWTRFGRFYIPGFENPLQVPWGFGLGAFLASGSQMAGVISGHQSIGSALGNIATQISLDSFIPIPVSRMSASDNPPAWIVDSLTPSMLRPVVEFVMNKNGLGQDIYNDSNRRMGDAYLGSDHIPETYKLIAANLFKETGGAIDISPNTLYFLANSYVDGPSRVVDAIVNGTYLVAGTKEFKAKTDVPFIGSFIGSVPNVDSREFKKFESEILEKQKLLNMTKNDPDTYYRILEKDPLAETVVRIYNQSSAKLNQLRQEANSVRRSQDYTPKEKTELLKANAVEQNIIKYQIVENFKAYGIKP
jgi:hypothetical protein